jgi:hypothetical protein
VKERLRALWGSNRPEGWVCPVVLGDGELLALLLCLLLGRGGDYTLRGGGGAGSLLGSDLLAQPGRTEEEHVVWSGVVWFVCGVCVILCV